MPQLENQVVFITGAAGGIGSCIAKLFAAEGAAVALLDRADSNLGALALEIEALGARVSVHPTDITDSQEVARAVAGAVEAHGKISSLVNAVGILRSGKVDEMTEADFDALMAVNVKGVWLAIRHTVAHLREAENATVINLSSVSAYVGTGSSFAYHTSKGAVSSMTLALAQELGADGIRVNAIAPGWVDAGFTHQARARSAHPEMLEDQARAAHVLGRMAQPQEVAQAALYLCSAQSSFVTGTVLFVDGGFMVKR
jgi:NAD(P)-dependent dehydrogenase (short-subunit alcohol dehydrogenase family)